MKRTLGTCYYPEHWPEDIWAEDARRMADLGLTWVRIGEFAWSRLEPAPGDMQFDWLDRAFEVLGAAGLRVVLGTPTATPPRWMLDRYPDMLALDAQGRPRGFGSRRHYCFSHDGYRDEAVRITTALAERYGQHPALGAWQTDNEYGCHDTVISYSDAARDAFRIWLADRYGTADALNRVWGNVFWSMDYTDFDQIDLPNLTVTEPNPSHVMDFRRFCSDQVVRFNAAQVEVIRARSDAPISHNYMGRITEFDHFATGAEMQIATWDSYPLGFLEDRLEATAEHKRRYACQGDPDFQAFHHDLYRSVGHGRWWVMEQQPGPVNWAPHNPAPLPGMARFWTWEAFAHGAEAVCYFRWRQAPFAQEQMHAGLLRPDSAEAAGYAEAARVAAELAQAPEVEQARSPVALIFDYQAAWSWEVQPQGKGCDYFRLVFEIYRGLRKLGLSVDILPPDRRDFTGYRMILAPGLEMPPEGLVDAIAGSGAQALFGPRFGSKTANYAIPVPLPPAISGLSAVVARVETLRPDMPVAVEGGGAVRLWREHLEGQAEVLDRDAAGAPVLLRAGPVQYLGGWPDPAYLARILERLAAASGLETVALPQDIRIRQSGPTRFVFNHGPEAVTFEGQSIPPAGVLRG
ncbi:beta-galactosidase [Rhodophyticola sp. CCM32]|uniref:beta-galactosidase n=1 Tax=Rhodophyticola sp. CCM32 TaxID=2916397 RepID=UPI00107FC380|nr:beta-galactosidase [Rhodophyticola sp. CCM32]QBY01574.1 beta-galactosidase [Rhodophyticola sp. CCM32]